MTKGATMNSIDNLREYVLTAPSICSTTRAILVGYIDNIEREVEDMVSLPVDADGVPVHVGDVMEFTYDPPQDQPMFEVSGFGANGTLFYAPRGEVAPRKTTNASVVRHHAPTVEDVLREFYVYAERGKEHHREDVDDAVLAEYAAKLRLAEMVDEDNNCLYPWERDE